MYSVTVVHIETPPPLPSKSQMVEDLQASLPTQFIQKIFALDSPVLLLRYSATEKVQLMYNECIIYMYMYM